ncbi:MAG: universal stress protein [Bacteroidales bacterium]|nr:universal stress protein [Bacteroidales bacterium]
MTNPRPRILVPYDFSELSDAAVKHAVQFAKITESSIVFLNIVPDLAHESEALKRLQEVAGAFMSKYGVDIECKIRPGRVSTAIRTYAETMDAFLVIMKTQRPKGREKYIGTRTVRLMAGSKIPFYVVQEPPKRLGLRHVVFPIDFRRENKEKLSWISILSKYYTSKIYFVKPKGKDYIVRNNLEFAKRFLEGKNIYYEIKTVGHKYNTVQDTLDFANEIKAELIIIMLSKNITFAKVMLGLKEQKYISNDYKIPVLCLNPRSDLRKYEGWF